MKEEIRKKQKSEKRQMNRLPSLANNNSSEEQKTKYLGERVDIGDLDLEEKEKLLRILFSKMN